MIAILEKINAVVWGVPTLVLILGVGIRLSICSGFAQLRLLPQAIRYFFAGSARKDPHGVSPMQALCTALAATVGTGNLAGVAGAMAIGGPGAIFWMWICGILGMITKMAEAALAVRYRSEEKGEWIGGPMYIIHNALGPEKRWLATAYAFFGVVAAFGVGNATQINAIVTGVDQMIEAYGGTVGFGENLLMGLVLAAVIGAVLLGGAKRIGKAAEALVPLAAVSYLALGIYVLIVRWDVLPDAFSAIVRGAFSPRAVTGGAVGSAVRTLQVGISRGVFTNEAGMGTAGIAHAGADVDHPIRQGLLGIVEVFADTIVICTMTALVILVSGVPIPYAEDPGAALTTQAFTRVCGEWASVVIAAELCCFAIATVLGWGLYGVRCAQFLFGTDVWRKFAAVQTGMVVLGAVMNTGTVWLLAQIVNGLMAVPNLIALWILTPEFVRLLRDFRGKQDGRLC